MERKGRISVQTTDIFPIIKKWLYSEHDVFLRELAANAADAITKRAALARTHNVEVPPGRIEVGIDKGKKTLWIEDNGLGMTAEEVEKYIARLAFSGAEEFVRKMESEKEKGGDIIGKFGLGFYSAFMVADKVEVESLGWEEGAAPCKWSCEGDTEYAFSDSPRGEVGTRVTLHVNGESGEFLDDWRVVEILRKFCGFMPYPIEVLKSAPPEDGKGDTRWKVNEVAPLWRRAPSEVKDEEYKEFYRTLFPVDREPLFWLHLKVDHPFTLEGILYFPKIVPKMSFQEKNIRLYNKQVFVSDNVKSVIPDFLSLLKGVIDSTDIPLNVSRSSLQGDPNIGKISNYIVKKVSESLGKLFAKDRGRYEEIWGDIGLFVKYGCVSDGKFDDSMRGRVVFKGSDGGWATMEELRSRVPDALREKLGDKILYFEKGHGDWGLLEQARELGVPVVEVDDHIDPHFLQHCEVREVGGRKETFSSLDSEISRIAGEDAVGGDDVKVRELFEKVLGGKGDPSGQGMEVEVRKFKTGTSPAFFKVDERMRRLSRMAESMGQESTFPVKRTLVVNPNGPLIRNILGLHEKGGRESLVEKLCHHVGDLASISGQGLEDGERDAFIRRTQDLMQELTGDLAKP